MSIIGSLLLGYEGKYNVLNTSVSFETSDRSMSSENSHFLVTAIRNTLHSYPFRVATLAFTHFFVHEMGHALTQQMLIPNENHIVIFTDQFGAYNKALTYNEGFQSSLISLAGPLVDMIYSCSLLAAAVLIQKHISKCAGYILGSGAVVWILGELVYAFSSALRDDIGDFARIAHNGIDHLLLSLSLLVSVCALGIFSSVKLAYSY
ncbi:M50 family metallopeptidase [Simkania negevensis]|uniref:Uncharacterized protein n=1 Tax=Simkania negevensis (strain ATCC VR-1471 / DSM 27360 / Z) TaxID=331113 RepID=F8L8F5_SIMNZ|nr:M50 family metallopeptidase [Simkania negevensis]CCB89078.1 unknown protein [Simkania negevensis Z]